MGLNIGIEVEAQDESYMSSGSNPKGTDEEVEARFFGFLNERFPEGGFGGGWVKRRKRYDGKTVWDFDVRMSAYGGNFPQGQNAMYLAIFEFVLNEFSTIDGLDARVYWSG